MKVSQTPIVPVKQAMVRIAGYEILAICMADGNTAAGLRMICDLLGVDRVGQLRKLQVDPAFRGCLILARVEIAGKQQVARFIIAEFIPLWLKGIHPSKVAPEARETLEEIRSVAVDALRAFFFPETKAQHQSAPLKEEAQQSAPPKQEPETGPLPPPPQEPPLSGLGHLHVGIESIGQKERQQDARLKQHEVHLKQHDTHLGTHDQQIEMIFEEVVRVEEQVTDLAETGPLMQEHKIELRIRLRALEHQTNKQGIALERELAAAFGVEVMEQLPEARWGQIVAWFHQRLGW